MDLISYVISKKYTDLSVEGLGAIKGADCKVESVEAITGGTRVTLSWTGTGGTKLTESFDVMNGINGIDGVDGIDGEDGNGIVSVTKTATVGLVDTYTITFTDGTTTTFNVTNGKAGELPEIINNRYLHTNETTGDLEWIDVDFSTKLIDASLTEEQVLSFIVQNSGKEVSGFFFNNDINAYCNFSGLYMSKTVSGTEVHYGYCNIRGIHETEYLVDYRIDWEESSDWYKVEIVTSNDLIDYQRKLPNVVKGRFLYTNPTTGEFEWGEAYTKTEIDEFLEEVYTKTETDNLLTYKADITDVYTKSETNDLLADKADADELIVVSSSVNQNWQGNGYNLIRYPYPFTEDINRGITFASNPNGGVIANGTVSESTLDAFTTIMNNFTLTAGTYVISDGISDSSDSKYWCTVYKQSDTSELARSTRNNGMFTLNSDTIVHIQVRVYRGTTINNVVFYPMLVKVSDDSSYPTEYQRYAMGNVEISDKISNIQEPTIVWENCTPLVEGTSFQVKNGVGYLSAHLNNVTISANTWKLFGTIPEGYRPNKSDIRFAVLIDGTTKACKGHITNTGVIGIYCAEDISQGNSAFVFNVSYIIF